MSLKFLIVAHMSVVYIDNAVLLWVFSFNEEKQLRRLSLGPLLAHSSTHCGLCLLLDVCNSALYSTREVTTGWVRDLVHPMVGLVSPINPLTRHGDILGPQGLAVTKS